MPTPTKSVKTMSKHLTQDEMRNRLEQEKKLRGADDKVSPPEHLTPNQKEIFNFIVKELSASGILGNLDIYILNSASIAIDRLQEIEKAINQDKDLLLNKDLLSAKNQYTKDFHKGLTELSLSPSSRAKLGNINLQAKQQEEDPLMQVLKSMPKNRGR